VSLVDSNPYLSDPLVRRELTIQMVDDANRLAGFVVPRDVLEAQYDAAIPWSHLRASCWSCGLTT